MKPIKQGSTSSSSLSPANSNHTYMTETLHNGHRAFCPHHYNKDEIYRIPPVLVGNCRSLELHVPLNKNRLVDQANPLLILIILL